MAAKLLKYYELVMAEGGVNAKMRMAMLTVVPSNIAGKLPDAPETVDKFKRAFKEITGKEAPAV
ncbi:MAG: hypothetical protein WA188_02335 [Terriglobales bacterium]